MKIVKFRVWDTDKPEETARYLTPEEMRSFVEGFHNIIPSIKMAHDGFLRDSRGVRIDVSGGKRTSEGLYNAWHRTLHRRAYYTNIDGLEYDYARSNEIILKAICDIKGWHVDHGKYLEESSSFNAIKKLADLADIPFYIIWVKFE
jgi:hypothetical protein